MKYICVTVLFCFAKTVAFCSGSEIVENPKKYPIDECHSIELITGTDGGGQMKICKRSKSKLEVEVSIGFSNRCFFGAVIYESGHVIRIVMENRFLKWDDSRFGFIKDSYSRVTKKVVFFDKKSGLPVEMEINGRKGKFSISEMKDVEIFFGLVKKWVESGGNIVDVENDIKNGI